MAKKKTPPKWANVYPQGTKAGDEEQKFFIALARHAKFEWRTVPALAKETGLTKERCEEIIQKYLKVKMIFNNPKNEDQWAYWERVPHMVEDAPDSIAKADQNNRINKALHSKADTWTAPVKAKGKKARNVMKMAELLSDQELIQDFHQNVDRIVGKTRALAADGGGTHDVVATDDQGVTELVGDINIDRLPHYGADSDPRTPEKKVPFDSKRPIRYW